MAGLKSIGTLRQLNKGQLLNYISDLHEVIRDTEVKIRKLALDVKYKK